MLFIHLTQNLPYEEAYAFVKARRPQTLEHPEWVKWVRENREW
jgi:hypothetical protein